MNYSFILLFSSSSSASSLLSSFLMKCSNALPLIFFFFHGWSFLSFNSQSKCHLLRKTFPDHPIEVAPSLSQQPYFLTSNHHFMIFLLGVGITASCPVDRIFSLLLVCKFHEARGLAYRRLVYVCVPTEHCLVHSGVHEHSLVERINDLLVDWVPWPHLSWTLEDTPLGGSVCGLLLFGHRVR